MTIQQRLNSRLLPRTQALVPQLLRCRFDGLSHVFLALGRRIKRAHFLKGAHDKDGASPGTEILRGNVVPTDFTQVGIYMTRFDIAQFTFLVDILEEFMPWQVLAAFDDFGELAIIDVDDMFLATFAAKMEMYLRAFHFDVLAAHSSQAVRIVLFGILLVANPDERDIEQAHDGRQHFLIG